MVPSALILFLNFLCAILKPSLSKKFKCLPESFSKSLMPIFERSNNEIFCPVDPTGMYTSVAFLALKENEEKAKEDAAIENSKKSDSNFFMIISFGLRY
jgi:hypothetical protein